MANKTKLIDLRTKIEDDTVIKKDEKGRKIAPNVDIKLDGTRILESPDPDSKQMQIAFSVSYDNRKRFPFVDVISIESESINSKNDEVAYARKYIKLIADAVKKKGIVNTEYSKDRYVFHREID